MGVGGEKARGRQPARRAAAPQPPAAGVADQPVSQTVVCDTRARAPSGARRRVSYPVSDSLSCRRQARVPVNGRMISVIAALFSRSRPPPPARASSLEHRILSPATATTPAARTTRRGRYIWNPAAVMLRRDLDVAAPAAVTYSICASGKSTWPRAIGMEHRFCWLGGPGL